MDLAAALVFAADAATAASGAFNAVWLYRFAAGTEPLTDARSDARRSAASALAILNAGAAAQATFGQAMYSSRQLGHAIDPFFEPGVWLASRLLLLAGTLLITAIILRRPSR